MQLHNLLIANSKRITWGPFIVIQVRFPSFQNGCKIIANCFDESFFKNKGYLLPMSYEKTGIFTETDRNWLSSQWLQLNYVEKRLYLVKLVIG